MTNISQTLQDYFDALERLKSGRPLKVMKGVRITNDSVALEAGRKKGSIKKSRPMFAVLIESIALAADAQRPNSRESLQGARAEKYRLKAHKQRAEVDVALASLVSRLYEIHELRKRVAALENQVADLTSLLGRASKAKVVPIQSTDSRKK